MGALKLAFRRLLRQPGFAAAAVATLAVGIAAPTALFTVVNGVLLHPLPYARAGDIYTVRTTMTDGRFTIGLLASEEIAALRRTADAIDGSALVVQLDDTVVTDAVSRQVRAFGVSEGFFDLFGVPMARGRSFVDDDHAATSVRNVVLAHRTWVSLFGADPAILGHTIRLASGPALVVGIAPPAFDLPRNADLWIAMRFPESIGHAFDAFVRFKPGLAPDGLERTLGPMWQDLGKKYPDMERNRAFVMRPLLQSIVGDLGPIAVIALAATGVLLLLAIVNVANLQLARGTARGREIAVRTTLGATTGDLVRQFLAESLVIAAAAMILGTSLAYGAVRLIVSTSGSMLPRNDAIHFDPAVWVFAAAVMIGSAIAIGLLPAARIAAPNLAASMNEGGRSGLHGRGTRRMLGVMVIVELALAIALVSGAGRLMLSVSHLLAVDPGFDAKNRLIVDVLLPFSSYRDPARAAAWADDAERRLRALGASSIATASTLPLRQEFDSTAFVDIVDHPAAPENRPNGRIRFISTAFFDSLRIPIVDGRAFTVDDRRNGAPVVIVNRAWVRKFIPGEDPLTTRVELGFFTKLVDGKRVIDPAAIVGVAGDVQYSSLTQDPEPVVYVCDTQVTSFRRSLIVQTADGAPERLVPQIRSELRAVDPAVPVEFDTMAHGVASALTWPTLGLMLMATFGVAGLVLAASGVFGVIAFVVTQRLSEMAVRLAIGATRGQVFRLVLVDTLRLAVTGLIIGVVLAWWIGQLMGRYVYHVTPANLLVLGGSSLAVVGVAVLATLPLAGRAATVEPARALRP
jgi:predicted permease